MKTYEVQVYYSTSKNMNIRARNRQEAIEKAAARAARLGLDIDIVRVPFLEGDEESIT